MLDGKIEVGFHYKPDFEGRIEPGRVVVPPLPPDSLVGTWRTAEVAAEVIAAEELKLMLVFPVDSMHQVNHALEAVGPQVEPLTLPVNQQYFPHDSRSADY